MNRELKGTEGGGRSFALSLFLLTAIIFMVSGCGRTAEETYLCSVVLEDCTDIIPDRSSVDTGVGEDVTFVLTGKNGCVVSGTDYDNSTLIESDGKTVLTLHDVQYSTVVKIKTAYQTRIYHANGGEGEDVCEAADSAVKNTRTEAFHREGYVQTGWNTQADGSGAHIGFGSRSDSSELYAEWEKETDSQYFSYESYSDGIRITGYTGQEDKCVLPEEIDGKKVRVVAAGAFLNRTFSRVICGDNLQRIEAGAFTGVKIGELTLSDNLIYISDESFSGCEIETLRLNARRKPVYAGSYFSAFPDKCDRLFSMEGKKLVLFSGSSARYGYDSGKIEEAFPQYQVVNMGTYAYTSARPQLEIIRAAMSEGDLLIEAPEFDAAGQQFCESTDLDRFFFALVEEDYRLIEYLDLRDYTNVFDALGAYLYEHGKLEEKDYSCLPSQYDDDGNRIDYPTYNEYGDYTLKRPDSEKDEMHRIIPADYTTDTITEERIASLNQVLGTFTEKGVTVLFTYAPRNQSSLTERSTKEAMQELEQQLNECLGVSVISSMEDYFYSGIYFYEIDNHLSDTGVALRTEQIIKDIEDWIEKNEQQFLEK